MAIVPIHSKYLVSLLAFKYRI